MTFREKCLSYFLSLPEDTASRLEDICVGELQNRCYVQSGATTKIKKQKPEFFKVNQRTKKQSTFSENMGKPRIFDRFFDFLVYLEKFRFLFVFILVVAPDWT